MPIKDFNGEVMGVAQVSFDRYPSLWNRAVILNVY